MAENINREEFTRWLSPYWLEIQEKLFPMIAQAGQEKPTQQIERLVQILEIVRVEESVSSPERAGKGRPCVDRRPLARAFVAKAVLNLPETKTLIEQLHQSPWLRTVCGMESVPSKATFSRAFAYFADQGLGDTVHQALLNKFVSGREESRPVVLHVSHDAKWLRHLRDSTAVEGRERSGKQPIKQVPEKKTRQTARRGRTSPS